MTGDIISQLGGVSRIEKSLSDNLNWVIKSFAYNNNFGSSSYRTVLGQYSSTYPETTGYLLITLLKAYDYTKNKELLELAKNQVRFFANIQNEDGSFFQKQSIVQPIIFDTAQIILGLCKLYEYIPNIEILDMIRISVNWLDSNLDEEGLFQNYNYKENYNPSYYARVFWPMLVAYNKLDKEYSINLISGIDRIFNSQNSNLSFPSTSFDEQSMAYTHTMAYTVRGLLECSYLLWRLDISAAVESYMDRVLDMVTREGQLFGAYDENWVADKSFVCVVGNLQFALIALKLDKQKYKRLITTLLLPVIKSQRSYGPNKGAIPSSLPIWGSYQRFKYTNWSQKFYSDTLLYLLNE